MKGLRAKPLVRLAATVVWPSLLIAAGGCSAGRSQMATDPSPGEELPILLQIRGTYSRLGRAVRILARDRATLAQVPLAEVPVDFDSQMVLIAGLGPTTSNEFGIRITRVWREGSRLCVQEQQIHPGPDRAAGLRPASPWTMAVVPKRDLNVEGYSTRVPEDLFGEHPGGR